MEEESGIKVAMVHELHTGVTWAHLLLCGHFPSNEQPKETFREWLMTARGLRE